MSKLPVLDLETKEQKSVENKKVEKKKRKSYTYDEAFEASTEYFGGDELAANVWINKYALKD